MYLLFYKRAFLLNLKNQENPYLSRVNNLNTQQMKNKLLLAFLIIGTTNVWALKHSQIGLDRVTLHNFSSNTFDASNMKLSINNQWFDLLNLTVMNGTLNAPAGSDVVIGGLTLPLSGASVALWYGSVDVNNPSAFDMASFVQYGFAGNPYEALAVQVSLWAAASFVHGGPPLTRDNDWSSDGASHWSGTILSLPDVSLYDAISYGPNPMGDELIINHRNENSTVDIVLVDLLGHTLFQNRGLKEEELRINTTALKEGVYFLNITNSEGQRFTQKIVKRE